MSEIKVTLNDGAIIRAPQNADGAKVAAMISPSLAKRAVAVKIDGELRDLSHPLGRDCKAEFVVREDADALDLIRHDCAHVLAQAVKQIYPQTQVTIGPVIENGFYYDFHRAIPFTPDDLEKIESRMRELIRADIPLVRKVLSREDAVDFCKKMGEEFKVELISAIPGGEEISFYSQGDFTDLCRGPHMPSTGKIGQAFKLLKVAGSYWRGDSKREQLQRIYGTAWRDEKELKSHLRMMEEAEKRDHRRLGREMNLFHLQDEAAGMIFWHDKGWRLYLALENYMRRRLAQANYEEVKTPQLVDRKLWEASGHWEKFREHMFVAESEEAVREFAADPAARIFALKPMNCPCHVQIYKQGSKSYRDLPLRMAEFGSCHRAEPSGALHGIMRVRNFVQDDAHIFCTEDQITSESISFCELLRSIYRDLGFDDVRVNFADRPPLRAGDDSVWDKAEAALLFACKEGGLSFEVNSGEGAFYGPKLEFVLRDAIGREWQCGTLQVDFVLPDRLNAEYTSADGLRRRPVMLHRAILGSFERFIGILIEHYAGHLPLWMSPVQAVVATITSDADSYAKQVFAKLSAADLRAEIDLRNEKINYKVREHSVAKIPMMLVVGKREAENGTVAIRRLGSKENKTLSLDEAVAEIKAESIPPDKKT